MGERELNEDLHKLQKLTGETNDVCFKAFVYRDYNIQKAIEYIKSRSESNLFDLDYE